MNASGQSTRLRFWDGSNYITRLSVAADTHTQFYSNGRNFVIANAAASVFDVLENAGNPDYIRLDLNNSQFGCVSYESGNVSKVQFKFDTNENEYIFRGNLQESQRTSLTINLHDTLDIGMFKRSFIGASWVNVTWNLRILSTGIMELGSTGLSGTTSLKFNVLAMIKPLALNQTNGADIIAAGYTTASYAGYICYSPALNKLIYSDGTDWRTLDSTAI